MTLADFLGMRHQLANRAPSAGTVVAAVIFAIVAASALLAPLLAPHDPVEQFRQHLLQAPAWSAGGSSQFLLGTDELGRDLLSRLLYGARISLAIGLASMVLASVPGIALGLTAAFFPRVAGSVILRAIDVLMALPGLLLAICVITVLGPGMVNTLLAIAIGALPSYVRLTRAVAQSELGKEYVTASRMAGAGTLRLMLVTVLPNCLPPLIVAATLSFSSAVLETAALGFLGLGVPAPTPELGSMLSAARDSIDRAPWVVMMPGIAILVTVLSINLLGDALRDVLDPKLKKAQP
jgi:dipeptide transport system permease protein